MRYRVDTQSLRMAEGNLLQVSSSLDTICVNILISALIEGYKNYKKSNPEFKHDFSHIWFEG